jgi:hypothetical protein
MENKKIKQKVITSFYPTNKAIDMQPVIDKFSSSGWTIKHIKPSIAITLFLENDDE